ncbi:hypothetical protein BVX93_00615 [bacterium B13(2017)]|nr:hypothetical protein BVX93_00615 [bacterium B13(2017)]
MNTQLVCKHSESCPLFPAFQMKSTLKLWQLRYCDLNPERCIRFDMFQKGNEPPINMLPNGDVLKFVQNNPG